MKAAAGIGNIVVGSAYLYLGLIIAEDLRRGWREMGFSHFGVGLAGLAFTCGPHHLVHGVHTLLRGRAGGPMDFATVLIGIPPGLVFLFLRSEALAGGRGDRFISGTPAWLASMPTVGGVYATALVAAAVQTRGDFALRPQMIANVVLIVLYTMIGSYIVRTQMRNRPQLGGWSVSGLSLALIFPTCTLMHASYAFYAASGVYADIDWHGLAVDWISVPAGIFFLWVVRGLYRQSLKDWNRFSFDSVPDRSAAVVAW